eukprot:394742_1
MRTLLALFNSYSHCCLCIIGLVVAYAQDYYYTISDLQSPEWLQSYLISYMFGAIMMTFVFLILNAFLNCFAKVAQCFGYPIPDKILNIFKWLVFVWSIWLFTTMGCVLLVIIFLCALLPKFILNGCNLRNLLGSLREKDPNEDIQTMKVHQCIIYVTTLPILLLMIIMLCEANHVISMLLPNVLTLPVVTVSSLTAFIFLKLDNTRFMSAKFQIIYVVMALFLSVLEILNIIFCLINHFYIPLNHINIFFIYIWDIICVSSIPYSLTTFYIYYLNTHILRCIGEQNNAFFNFEQNANQTDSKEHIHYLSLDLEDKEQFLNTMVIGLDNSKSDSVYESVTKYKNGKLFQIYLVMKAISLIVFPVLWFFFVYFVYDVRHLNALWVLQLFAAVYVLYFGYILKQCENYLGFIRYLKMYEKESDNKYSDRVRKLHTNLKEQYPVYQCLLDANILIEIANIIMRFTFDVEMPDIEEEKLSDDTQLE